MPGCAIQHTLERAVLRAPLRVAFISQHYLDSANCRTEWNLIKQRPQDALVFVVRHDRDAQASPRSPSLTRQRSAKESDSDSSDSEGDDIVDGVGLDLETEISELGAGLDTSRGGGGNPNRDQVPGTPPRVRPHLSDPLACNDGPGWRRRESR